MKGVETGRKAKVGAPKTGVKTGGAQAARLSERVVAGAAGWDDEFGAERSTQQLFFPQSQCPQRGDALANSALVGRMLCASTTTALRMAKVPFMRVPHLTQLTHLTYLTASMPQAG